MTLFHDIHIKNEVNCFISHATHATHNKMSLRLTFDKRLNNETNSWLDIYCVSSSKQHKNYFKSSCLCHKLFLCFIACTSNKS